MSEKEGAPAAAEAEGGGKAAAGGAKSGSPSAKPSTTSKVAKKKGKLTFFYDPETKACLGRTCLSWFKIFIFYVIFFSFLAAIGAAALHILLVCLPTNQPLFTWKYFGCAIDKSQGIGNRPKTPLTKEERDNTMDQLRSTVIWVKEGNDDNARVYINDLLQVMQDEKNLEASSTCKDFSKGCKVHDQKGDWGDCKYPGGVPGPKVNPDSFGYKAGQPCVMIRLNRLFDWEPERKENIVSNWEDKKKEKEKRHKDDNRAYLNWRDEFKDDMSKTYKVDIADIKKSPFVWIQCRGETRTDDANIGPLQYYPQPGIPMSYFPFTSKLVQKWASPYIMVQFKNVRRGVLISVKCEAFNKNIEPRTGVVRFGIMVDPA